ncbi:hypothetical protein ASD83_15575 [Devosia sp. Root685]|uniref:hypothetical protein n=1 Tax=Devosia sp. Root685 TaxID=1736587 RepID=UPI0006FD3F73|nr:hypothetical protein [Devosia sp. Root685]KRA96524.1 hypothetical protein ASD83_15575 [Devosia sp. Root685]
MTFATSNTVDKTASFELAIKMLSSEDLTLDFEYPNGPLSEPEVVMFVSEQGAAKLATTFGDEVAASAVRSIDHDLAAIIAAGRKKTQ